MQRHHVTPTCRAMQSSLGREESEAEGSALQNDSVEVFHNVSNVTISPYYQHSLLVATGYILAYLLIFLLCMVGNVLVCLIVMENRHMRTVINLFIFNLALSDLLVGIFCIPITLVDNLITGQTHKSAGSAGGKLSFCFRFYGFFCNIQANAGF